MEKNNDKETWTFDEFLGPKVKKGLKKLDAKFVWFVYTPEN